MLSIIVPVKNEEQSLVQLHQEIASVCFAESLQAEVIFIDDGSTDRSWAVIEELAAAHRNVRGIRFRRNFGKAAALTAGMREAHGDLILMMDGDLQDDPAEIPAFLKKLADGYDVVNGWKKRRLDPWHKVYPSKVFNGLASLLSGLHLHDHNCGFKLFRTQVAEELRLYGEFHRFIPILAHARGFRVAEIPVHHRERQHGQSKYGIRRFIGGLLDLFTVKFLTSYSYRPQHMLGALGLLLFGLGSMGLTGLGAYWVLMNVFHRFPHEPIGTRPLLTYSVVFVMLGAQAITLGLLAELIVAKSLRHDDLFSIASRTASPAEIPPPVDSV